MLRKEKRIINDTKEMVQFLNDHYINPAKRSCGEKSSSVTKQSLLTNDVKIVDNIVCYYEDDASVRHIKKNVNPPPRPPKTIFTCSLLTISEQEVQKILKELRTEKSAGVDTIPPKLVKLDTSYLAGPLLQPINSSIKKGCFPKMQRLLSYSHR